LAYKEIVWANKSIFPDDQIKNNWHEISCIDETATGFDARIYVNDRTKEINISFEGSHGFTKLLGENILDARLLDDVRKYSGNFSHHITLDQYNELYAKWRLVLGKDGLADLQILADQIPDQFFTAYRWFKTAMAQIRSSVDLNGYKNVLTGHSLAGGLAQLVSAQYYLETGEAIPTVALQGPGMLSQMRQLAGRDIAAEEFSHIVNFITEGDPVGEFCLKEHVGLTVSMPYTLARGDKPPGLPNYRLPMKIYQELTGIADSIRIDRHEIGQQIAIFDGTDFSYPRRESDFNRVSRQIRRNFRETNANYGQRR